jgi:hypothetical protein
VEEKHGTRVEEDMGSKRTRIKHQHWGRKSLDVQYLFIIYKYQEAAQRVVCSIDRSFIAARFVRDAL